MNTRQKLTLGIAAIFMVTLTIVGVTYAYFVTRVTGTVTESVNVQTAEVGSVIYENGNGTSDVVTLNDILPGTTLYKSFRVTNQATNAGAIGSYTIFMESTPDTDEGTGHPLPQFVHGSAGAVVGTGDDNVCYKSTAVQSNGNTIAGNVVSSTATATCFDDDEYNNVYVTLYEVTAAQYVTGEVGNENYLVNDDGTIDDNTVLTNTVKPETHVAANSGIVYTTASQDLSTALTINGNTTKYYVLKVEYKNNGVNQNIENDAKLTLKVSIR